LHGRLSYRLLSRRRLRASRQGQAPAFRRGVYDSLPGRVLRGIIGLILILADVLAFWNRGGIVLVLAGLVPLLSAINDICFLGPLLDRPLRGDLIRQQRRRTA